MKISVASLLAGSAAALSPAQVAKATTALNYFESDLDSKQSLVDRYYLSVIVNYD